VTTAVAAITLTTNIIEKLPRIVTITITTMMNIIVADPIGPRRAIAGRRWAVPSCLWRRGLRIMSLVDVDD
jgi:hypothetical protein